MTRAWFRPNGDHRYFPVFPRSKKRTTFTDEAAAMKALLRRANGHGVVTPAMASPNSPEADWSQFVTVAL